MCVRGALLLEDALPDGWTMRSGDRAEGLTLGVATKREESPLLIRATHREQDPKAASEDHVDLFLKKPLTSDGARPGCFVGTSDGAVGG